MSLSFGHSGSISLICSVSLAGKGFACLPKDKLNSFYVMNRKKKCLSTPQASIIAVIYRITGVEYSIMSIWQLRYK